MELKEEINNDTKSYPVLSEPSAPEGEIHIVEGTAHTYRLQNISEIQQEIEREREKTSMLSKKYHLGVMIIDAVDDSLVVATMELSV